MGRTVLGNDVRAGPGLADTDGLRVHGEVVVSESLEVGKGARVVLIGAALVDQVLHRIEPETIHPHGEPMVDDVIVVIHHRGILHIPVGHTAPEEAVIPAIAAPMPVTAGIGVRPDVPVAVGVGR